MHVLLCPIIIVVCFALGFMNARLCTLYSHVGLNITILPSTIVCSENNCQFALSKRININLVSGYIICILFISYDVASGSEITPCIKINKPLTVYRFQ